MNINLDTTIFIGFLVINIMVGLFYCRNISTIKEYAIGNHNFSTATIAATLVATWVSGSDFFTYLSEAYNNGLYFIWAATGDVFCLLLVGYFFAPRLGEFLGKLSIAEAMGDLFGKRVRIITAIAGCIGAGGIIAVQLKVSGILFEYCFGIPSMYGIIIGGIIVAIYSSLGGIKSVTFTDVIQLFTFGTIIPTAAFFILQTVESIDILTSTLQDNPLFDYKQVFDFTQPKALSYLFLFFFIAVPGFNPAIFQRIAMAKNTIQIRKSFIIAGFTCLFITFTMSWIGVIILSTKPEVDPNDIVKHIVFNYSYTGLKGLTLAGIMAMVMSTADSYINSTAILFVHDFCKPLKIKFIKDELTASRITSFLITIFALLLALTGENLLNLIIITNTFYLPIVTVPFILALLGFRSTGKSVLIGMVGGSSTVIMWKMFLQTEVVDSVIPGMLANLVFLIGSHYVLKQSGGWVGIKDDKPLKKIRHARKIKIRRLINSITNFNIGLFLRNNQLKSEAMYVYFGLFCIISIYSTMHTLPKEIQLQYVQIINFIYPSVLFMATILITYPLWLASWKETNIISIFWNLTVFYSLICVGFLLVIISNFAPLQVMVLMLNLILIAGLMRWQWALLMMIVGFFTTISFLKFYLDSDIVLKNSLSLQFKIIYLFLLVSSIIIAFFKPKQEQQELTEEKNNHLNGRINAQEKELHKALGIKEEFIRNVQHEYHAPMTGVVSLTQSLLASYKTIPLEQIGKYLENIYRSAVRIDSYDNNINMLSKLSNDDYELHLELIDISSLVYNRLEICRKLYEQNKDDREFIVDIEENILANIDREYFIKLLDNLIINAISYCKVGKIIIKLKRNNKNNISISIEDEGIGIPQEEIYNIFDPFIVSSKTWSPAGGRGIGLALCKRVIELHGGKITAESDGIKGSVFKLSLPSS